jgi:hypothetical protein
MAPVTGGAFVEVHMTLPSDDLAVAALFGSFASRSPPSRVARALAVVMMCGGMLGRSGYQVRPFVVTHLVAFVDPGPSRKMGSSRLVFELTC